MNPYTNTAGLCVSTFVVSMVAVMLVFWLIAGFPRVTVSISCPAGQHQVKQNTKDGYSLWCSANK